MSRSASGSASGAMPEVGPFTAEQAELLLDAARAAPSIHNSQPWRFAVRADRVDVHVDRGRRLAAVDPDGRQQLISCGAATVNLRLAMAHLGWEPRTVLDPGPAGSDLVATVVRDSPRAPGPEERKLYSMIHYRHTNRGSYRPQPVPASVLAKLRAAAERDLGQLRPVAGPAERAGVAELIARGIDRHAATPAISAEFGRWTSDEAEPVAGTPFESWLSAPYPLPALTRRVELTAAERAQIDDLVAAGTFLLLWTAGDTPVDRLRAGQALQSVLLTATAAGVGISFLNQPVEVPSLRAELASVLGTPGAPQMLLRAGYARSAPLRTGRRPVGQVAE